jgi:hypothetical protein
MNNTEDKHARDRAKTRRFRASLDDKGLKRHEILVPRDIPKEVSGQIQTMADDITKQWKKEKEIHHD